MSVVKQVSESGEIWYREVGQDRLSVGLTPEFLSMIQDECWNIIPNGGSIKKGQPLFSVETNDSLLTVISPFNGSVEQVAWHAQNSPEKLTTECQVLSVFTGTKKARVNITSMEDILAQASVEANPFQFAGARRGRAINPEELDLRPTPPVPNPEVGAAVARNRNVEAFLRQVARTGGPGDFDAFRAWQREANNQATPQPAPEPEEW